ncbi:hypothetical protein [Streptomyces sp. NRRL F-5053]|uniref:hypothetical protein n=1 Tax=Streptomyces sp. NRRL F-5053 TaxID=1463854 RepID=UPI001331C267|nr:hypothetical protein [Streptomyces sp. NRRL F-5053]
MENLPLHELGLLRGAVEGCDTRYFGSLLALDQHAHLVLRAGLVAPIPAGTRRDDGCQFYEATTAGHEFYAAHLSGLDDRAKGRANSWRDHPQLAAAARALGRLLDAVEHPVGPTGIHNTID